MHRLQLFLLVDGVVIAAGAILLFYVVAVRRKESYFRDDLWKEKARLKNEKSWLEEDQRDHRIFLEFRLNPNEEDETTQPMSGPPPGSRPPGPKPAGPSLEFAAPKFRGKPHEVLGVPEEASLELIGRAYKHWIKRYHPDRVTHLGEKYVEQARRRAEQLNTARQALLARRKS